MDPYFFLCGVFVILISWIWVVILAFDESAAWGIFSFLLNPFDHVLCWTGNVYFGLSLLGVESSGALKGAIFYFFFAYA